MTLKRSYRFFILLLAGWFLAVQSLSVVHATTYGDAPHKHNGVLCTSSVMTHEAVTPLSVPVLADYVVYPVDEGFVETVQSVLYLAPHVRAPPPRAPPFKQ